MRMHIPGGSAAVAVVLNSSSSFLPISAACGDARVGRGPVYAPSSLKAGQPM